MGTTLDHGIYLPDEGERNCYDGLAGNWVALDNHLGSTDIHVTINDKQAWNGHVADTTIHVTSADKQAWNGHVADSVKHVTAEDKAKWDAVTSKANDSNVVHKSGNETISGDKVFNNRLIKNIDVVLGTAPSTSKFSNIDIADNNKLPLLQIMGGVYDTGQSYARFFVQNKTADDGSGLSPTGTIRSCGSNINLPANSTSEGWGSITPRANKTTDLGLVRYQWRNVWCEKLYLNGTQLDSSLSLPSDRSARIDISSYITNLGSGNDNIYTVPANGYIFLNFTSVSGVLCFSQTSGGLTNYAQTFTRYQGEGQLFAFFPVRKGDTFIAKIYTSSTAVVQSAYFIPCQGNV